MIVSSGLQLEGRLAALVERLAPRRPVLAVGDRLPRDRLLAVTDELFDPHVWFDAGLWSLCPPLVAEALAAIDPPGATGYRERAAAHAAALVALDADVRARIASIPEQRRVLVTAHDAFRYFGRAYGIEVVGVQGTSTESEAGLHDVNRLVELLVSRGIPAVFVETSVSDRNVAALREGAMARGRSVALGGSLYSDSLGGPGSGAETLETALAANVETIVAGLTGGR
jgi:manganese/zinc/iron transport system substrate-binding protein